jgi:hypothetical protein
MHVGGAVRWVWNKAKLVLWVIAVIALCGLLELCAPWLNHYAGRFGD